MSAGEAPVVIVGSGPAAAAAALALTRRAGSRVLVLDLGGQLDEPQEAAREGLAESPPERWDPSEVATISQQPVAASRGALPQKRAYGSDFPFRDLGQLQGMAYAPDANSSPVSSAYGGFSNVWGAQLMPFSRATFDTWPVGWDRMIEHYRAVLDEVPLAGEADDYESTFPLIGRSQPLPPLAQRSRRVLERYEQHRSQVNEHGVTVGRARLAMQAHDCVRCGLCMTGCPYRLIYSASLTFDRLRRAGSVDYRSGVLALGFGEDETGSWVNVLDRRSGRREQVRAERIFVACGGIGSTRLALASLANRPETVTMGESVQFALPFLSTGSTGDPRVQPEFTLNQFNMLVSFDDRDYHTSHVHCYPFNPSVFEALPAPLRAPALSRLVGGALLSRLTIGLGYLPSWASPPVRLSVRTSPVDELPGLEIGGPERDADPLMLGKVLQRLRGVGRALDLHPIASQLQLAGPAKSYHFGGSLPLRATRRDGDLATDVHGRPPGFDRVHLIDGAVFPSVPSTTFTFTVMANAHRIVTEVLDGADPA